MKNIIYYFSGTGNSYIVAKGIADAIKSCELVRITDSLMKKNISISADRFGIVYPVYAFAPPAIVQRFILNLKKIDARYIFAVAVHGGGPASAQRYCGKIFERKDCLVNGFFDVEMPSNYIIRTKKSREKESEVLAKSTAAIKAIGRAVSGEKPSHATSSFGGMIHSALINPLFALGLKRFDKDFLVTHECTGCKICEKVCPASNISMSKKHTPVWQHHCEQCMACMNWCPVHAILYKDNSPKRNFYHHPKVKAADLIAQM